MRTLIALALAVASMAVHAEETRCDDQSSWTALDELRAKYKGTDGEGDVEFLYRFRLFICDEIKAGRLTYAEASPLYDHEKQRVILKWSKSSGGASSDPRQATLCEPQVP